VEEVSAEAEPTADFEEDSEDVDEEHNREDFHEADSVEAEEDTHHMYRRNASSVNKWAVGQQNIH
jgi:hypothetical protein